MVYYSLTMDRMKQGGYMDNDKIVIGNDEHEDYEFVSGDKTYLLTSGTICVDITDGRVIVTKPSIAGDIMMIVLTVLFWIFYIFMGEQLNLNDDLIRWNRGKIRGFHFARFYSSYKILSSYISGTGFKAEKDSEYKIFITEEHFFVDYIIKKNENVVQLYLFYNEMVYSRLKKKYCISSDLLSAVICVILFLIIKLSVFFIMTGEPLLVFMLSLPFSILMICYLIAVRRFRKRVLFFDSLMKHYQEIELTDENIEWLRNQIDKSDGKDTGFYTKSFNKLGTDGKWNSDNIESVSDLK